jgi:hypothetical protein
MKKYYRVYNFGTEISEIEIIKETEHTIWYKSKSGSERQERKNTSDTKHFETFKEAKEYLINKYSDRIEYYENQLKIAIETLEKIKLLTQ